MCLFYKVVFLQLATWVCLIFFYNWHHVSPMLCHFFNSWQHVSSLLILFFPLVAICVCFIFFLQLATCASFVSISSGAACYVYISGLLMPIAGLLKPISGLLMPISGLLMPISDLLMPISGLHLFSDAFFYCECEDCETPRWNMSNFGHRCLHFSALVKKFVIKIFKSKRNCEKNDQAALVTREKNKIQFFNRRMNINCLFCKGLWI